MSARLSLCLIFYYGFLLCYISSENAENKVDIVPKDEFDINIDVESLIAKFQELAVSAENLQRDGVRPVDDVEHLYEDMIEILDELIDVVNNSNNAYKFHKAKGLDRIVVYGLKVTYEDLKTRILILLKVLFDVAPTTTSAVIPITIVDQVMDVYERDNLALKSLSLEVLSLWLPENPKVQARIMKMKGLEPFYDQVERLDADTVNMLLVLFNKLLKEHLKARSEVQRTIIDADNLKFYQRIGLIERMETPTICNGLLNIFANIWSYNSQETHVMMTVFELLKNVKQFCLKLFRGKSKAVQLFTALQHYVKGSQNKQYFVVSGLNVTEIALLLEEYVDNLKNTVKEEL